MNDIDGYMSMEINKSVKCEALLSFLLSLVKLCSQRYYSDKMYVEDQ